MSNRIIKRVQFITSQGVGPHYVIGENGVTDIRYTNRRIGEYDYIGFYTIFGNDGEKEIVIADISETCPVVLTY